MAGILNQGQLDTLINNQNTSFDDLKKLQDVEMQLFESLQKAVSSKADQSVKDQLLSQIKLISEVRQQMYKRLISMYKITQDNVSQTRADLVDQFTLVDIMQQQLDNLHDNINIILNAKNDRMRMVEINTYFGKQYEAQKELMQIIVLTSVPLLVLAILSNAGTIGSTVAGILGTFVIAIGLFFVVRKIIDISSRSNTNFDEYDWQFNPNSMPETMPEYTSTDKEGDDTFGCYSQECCAPGTVFDSSIGKCVPNVVEGGIKKITDSISSFASNIASNASSVSGTNMRIQENFEGLKEKGAICPNGFELIKDKNWLSNLGLGKTICGSGIHNGCNIDCAYDKCEKAGGTWVPTDYSYAPYLCDMSNISSNAKPTPK